VCIAYYQQRAKAYIPQVEQALRFVLNDAAIPEALRESMAYSVFAGGKRLRPCMCLAACELNAGNIQDAMPFACALEMIHTYSLIHDDLPAMDNDDFRRGRPTNHKVYGEGNAILAGDALLSYAVEIMTNACLRHTDADASNMLRAMQTVIHAAGAAGMVAGQSLDLKAEAEGCKDTTMLQTIHKGKTAAMLVASVVAGACCANASREHIDALRAFGEQYGLLFQITDDILDVEGDPVLMGKTLGKDAQNGKLTYPAIYGLAVSRSFAENAAKTALAALDIYGEEAAFFRGLVTYTMSRKS